MSTELTYDQLEERLAQTCGELLKTILHVARARNSGDLETVAEIAALKACRLTISAVGPQLQLELIGPVEGGTKRFFGATFAEAELQ